MKYEIIFKKAYTLEKDKEIDAIRIYYDYEIDNENHSFDNDETENIFVIMVSISGSLACEWGFSIWQDESNYQNLMKILLPIATELIISKLKIGALKKYEEKKLMTNNAPEYRSCDHEKLPEVFNHKIEIEV